MHKLFHRLNELWYTLQVFKFYNYDFINNIVIKKKNLNEFTTSLNYFDHNFSININTI